MNDLQNLNLIELLPTSIASDETIRNICNAIAEKLQTINEKAELVLLLPRLDQLPETLVDELAWQYHVDFYDYAADINKKRALVRKAIDLSLIHISEPTRLGMISYAVFCLKKKN